MSDRQQPRLDCRMPTAPAIFSVTAAGTGPFSFQWEAWDAGTSNWAPIANGAVPGIGVVAGSTTDTLTVSSAAAAAPPGHSFRCVVTNACGSATSSTAALTICRADFNCDGTVNSGDFFGFLTPFFNHAPEADFNRDGSADSQDFFDFLATFFTGC